MNPLPVFAHIQNISIQPNGIPVLKDINLTIHKTEQWAIIGASGSGKTTLARALAGKLFTAGTIQFNIPDAAMHSTSILLVEQQHHFKDLSNTSDFYYQQRFNSSDAENTITVEEALRESLAPGQETTGNQWVERLHLASLLQKPLIQLSNGENKRLQLAKALLKDPAVLIMDNPYVGLDVEGRSSLNNILDAIVASNIHIILITSPQHLPPCITHVAVLEKGTLAGTGPRGHFDATAASPKPAQQLPDAGLFKKLVPISNGDFAIALKMVDVTIRYGEKIILQQINWEVKKGECWNISGPNGSGKSTLLSLVTADNPQAYANELYLFDKRRGRGESIWDIKQRIGFVSPELHLFFDQSATCFEVIASGLFDTIGLFRQLSAAQHEQVMACMELLQLQLLHSRRLFQLSLGQQRMVLLGRALVKNPPLLILDEPTQGLDEDQVNYFKDLITYSCEHFNTTLLYVSHYEKDIPACVSHYLKLDDGKILNIE
jgi:molybdate transport system ATP-binding protein